MKLNQSPPAVIKSLSQVSQSVNQSSPKKKRQNRSTYYSTTTGPNNGSHISRGQEETVGLHSHAWPCKRHARMQAYQIRARLCLFAYNGSKLYSRGRGQFEGRPNRAAVRSERCGNNIISSNSRDYGWGWEDRRRRRSFHLISLLGLGLVDGR
jgi:hypothetical protein